MVTKKERRKFQCPFCINTIQDGRMARHITTHHSEKVKEWIHGEEFALR